MKKKGIDKLKIMSGSKFFLAAGYCLLVASMFLPFATEFSYILVFPDPGPYTGPPLASRVIYWSFMHVQESLEKSGENWVVKNTQWLVFNDYWNWWGQVVAQCYHPAS